ncbi:MAG: hypothetical protein Q7R35_03975 [Elusimicrobiota bacterium]|nr:hypothetical protein [Elusimicrobiota bacterium]
MEMEKDSQPERQLSISVKPHKIITASLFEAYLKCPTKFFLRSVGEMGHGNTSADWVQAQKESYRTGGINRLMGESPNGECIVGPLNIEDLKNALGRKTSMLLLKVSEDADENHSYTKAWVLKFSV